MDHEDEDEFRNDTYDKTNLLLPIGTSEDVDDPGSSEPSFCCYDLRIFGRWCHALCDDIWWTCCHSFAWRESERRQRIDQDKALRIISRWNCRIKASSIGGVGLFALRNLPVELSLSHIEVNRWPPFLLSGYVNLDWGKT